MSKDQETCKHGTRARSQVSRVQQRGAEEEVNILVEESCFFCPGFHTHQDGDTCMIAQRERPWPKDVAVEYLRIPEWCPLRAGDVTLTLGKTPAATQARPG